MHPRPILFCFLVGSSQQGHILTLPLTLTPMHTSGAFVGTMRREGTYTTPCCAH